MPPKILKCKRGARSLTVAELRCILNGLRDDLPVAIAMGKGRTYFDVQHVLMDDSYEHVVQEEVNGEAVVLFCPTGRKHRLTTKKGRKQKWSVTAEISPVLN